METSQAPMVQTKQKLPGVIDLIKQAWGIYKENVKNIIGILIIPLVLQILIGIKFASFFISKSLKIENLESYFNSLSEKEIISLVGEIFVTIGPMLLLLIVLMGICSYAVIVLIIKRKNGFGIKESLSQAFNQIFKMFWTSFLVCITIFVGFLLFIIPGIIFFFWFMFSQYVLIDQDIAGTKAMAQSKKYISGIIWDVVVIFLGILLASFFASIVLGFLPDMISNIVSAVLISPIIIITMVLLYENVKVIKEPKQNPEIAI